jgi:hypothetical protein
MAARRVVLTCAWIGALFFLVTGAWSLLAPHSFFDVVAGFPPYNRHLFHDEGAFKLGLAAGLLAAIFGRSGLPVGLWAGAVGASAHALSHWIDADLGGSSTASALLTVLAAALAAGLVVAETRRMQPRHESPPYDAGRLNSIVRGT